MTAGETATVSRSAPVVVTAASDATTCAVSARYRTTDAPLVETPFVNMIGVAVPKSIAAPVSSLPVGVVAGLGEAFAPESVIWCSPV